MPKVSIIVPIYNVEKYIERCIDSIINQTLKDIEIILVDDGSTDRSGEIADDYAKKDSRIIVIHKENEGQGAARNIGIDIAKGEYIGFIDSDDWIDINMYERMYYSVKESKSDIGVCSRKIFDNNYKLGSIRSVEENFEYLLNENTIINYIINHLFYPHTVSSCNKLYAREVIKKNGIRFRSVDEVGSEDALFNYCILLNSGRIKTVSDVYYNGVEREGSTTRIYKKGCMKRTAKLIKYLNEYSTQIGKDELGKKIAPIMLLFFQQWNYKYIKSYSNISIVQALLYEQKLVKNEKEFKLAEKQIVFNNKFKWYMKEMGYTNRGILFIKVYMLFSLINLNWMAVKVRTLI